MIIVPFKAEHLHTLNLQSAQALFGPLLTDAEYGKSLEDAGNAFTGIVDGETIICSGVVEQWQNRAVAWALISENSGKHFVAIHKAVSRFLKVCDYRRVEAYVDDRFENFVELNNAGICCFLFDAPHNTRYDVGYKRIKSLSELV